MTEPSCTRGEDLCVYLAEAFLTPEKPWNWQGKRRSEAHSQE